MPFEINRDEDSTSRDFILASSTKDFIIFM